MLSNVPAFLIRRAFGLFAILSVLFLLQFPSPGAVTAVCTLLVGGFLIVTLGYPETATPSAPTPALTVEEKLRRVQLQAQKVSEDQLLDQSATRMLAPAARNSPGPGLRPTTEVPHSNKAAELLPASKAQRREYSEAPQEKQDSNTDPQPASQTVATNPANAVLKQRNGNNTGKNAASNAGSAAAGGPPLVGGAAVLARLRQQRAQAKAAEGKSKEKEVIVAYASQTGTAQEIAKSIQAESSSHGIVSRVLSLNELTFEKLAGMGEATLVVIAASTGDGDSPDNAAKFYATLKRKTQEAGTLKNVKFTCLGLGDSNYTRFMGVSRAIRTRMQDLGAQMFYKFAEADEVDGLESTVDPWTEGLWPQLKALNSKSQAGESKIENGESVKDSTQKADGLIGVPALPACRIKVRWVQNATNLAEVRSQEEGASRQNDTAGNEGLYSPDQPFWAPVTSAKYLTATTSDRKVLHLEFNLTGSRIEYIPGDSLGVTPQNDATLVDSIVKRLDVDGSKVFDVVAVDGDSADLLPHLHCPVSVRNALLQGCDLTSTPRKSFLRLLAEHCTDAKEKHELMHLSSRGGREEYKALSTPFSPSLLDLLSRFSSCKPPLADLLDALPPLAPRLYSVSSSPLEHPNAAHVALSVVRLGHPNENVSVPYPGMKPGPNVKGPTGFRSASRWGVATGWLERQVEPLLSGNGDATVKVPIHLRKGGGFRHPDDLSAPLVMIGPGTGVAPFRGFLESRRQLLKNESSTAGPSWLFFGCRSPDEDYLYHQDFKGFEKDGTLTKLVTAFSRLTDQKVYVQHKMREEAEQLAPLVLSDKAYVFVCGDGANMAKDVHATLISILEEHGSLSNAEAIGQLANMTKQGRYIRDIWS